MEETFWDLKSFGVGANLEKEKKKERKSRKNRS